MPRKKRGVAFAVGLLMPAYRKWVVYSIFGWGIVAIYTHIQATPPQFQMLGGPIVFLILNTVLFFLKQLQRQLKENICLSHIPLA